MSDTFKTLSPIIWVYLLRYKKVEGDTLIDYSASLRPTRKRLLAAMGISSCFVALLLTSLGSLVDFELNISIPGFERGDTLTVHIRKSEPKRDSSFTIANKSVRSLPREQETPDDFSEDQREHPAVDSPEQTVEIQSEKDWHAIAKEAAKTSVATNSRQEESRATMWRQSRSIMFQPADDIGVIDEEPLLSDIQFIRRSRVLGLGFNFGSCFIGIPIAGVPVEDRTVGITLFVCTSGS